MPEPVRWSISQGVKYLSNNPEKDVAGHEIKTGHRALIALTLLECGVNSKDPEIQKRLELIRRECPSLRHNYSLSLVIVLFDRLGNPGDVELIHALGARLLANLPQGGFHYECPEIPAKEVQRVDAIVKKIEKAIKDKTELPKEKVATEVTDYLTQIKKAAWPDVFKIGDNSNTQFASLGLWVAKRNGLDVDEGLARIDGHFRRTQNADAGWGYKVPGPDVKEPKHAASTAAMTCAALMSLGISHGVDRDKVNRGEDKKERDLNKDAVIRNALVALGRIVGKPVGFDEAKKLPKFEESLEVYYFFWSLERIASLFSLDTIGGKDWYTWGAELIVPHQQANGKFHDVPCTCFALLYLTRSNFTKDLSTRLKGKLNDPGRVTLKGGGTTGEDPKIAVKSPIGTKTPVKPGEDIFAKAMKLSTDLIDSPKERQEEVIERLKTKKGAENTIALASAIPKLHRTVQGKARDALTERLSRMTASTIRSQLKEGDDEIRRAAAAAAAEKEDKSLVPDLIGLLDDKTPMVGRAAYASLRRLTKQDFGPSSDASRPDRLKAIAKWQDWWDKNK